MGRDPRVLQEELQAASGIVVLKILPSYHESIPPVQVTHKHTQKRHMGPNLFSLFVMVSIFFFVIN